MIHLAVRRVNPELLEIFRKWMAQLNGPRHDEALATLVDEGCSHELVGLIEGPDGPLVIYAMEVESIEKSSEAAHYSAHQIDKDHRAVIDRAIGERLSLEKILDLH